MANVEIIDCLQISIDLLKAIYNRIEKKRINLEKNNLNSFNIMIVIENCPYCHNVINAVQRSFKIYDLDCKLKHYKVTNTNKYGYSFMFNKITHNFDDLPF